MKITGRMRREKEIGGRVMNNKTSCGYKLCHYYVPNVVHFCCKQCSADYHLELVVNKILNKRKD